MKKTLLIALSAAVSMTAGAQFVIETTYGTVIPVEENVVFDQYGAADVDYEEISSIYRPMIFTQGTTSATSTIINLVLPENAEKVHMEYITADGNKMTDTFAAGSYIYAANLPAGTVSPVKIAVLNAENKGVEKTIEVSTKSLDEKYVPYGSIPFYNDDAFRCSLSYQWAPILAPRVGATDWGGIMMFEYLNWWNTWANSPGNMPSCQDIEDFTALDLYGDVKTLVDILPFVNLETLTFLEGIVPVGSSEVAICVEEGKSISASVDFSVLRNLKKLKKIVIGAGVNLTAVDFAAAGLDGVTIEKQ